MRRQIRSCQEEDAELERDGRLTGKYSCACVNGSDKEERGRMPTTIRACYRKAREGCNSEHSREPGLSLGRTPQELKHSVRQTPCRYARLLHLAKKKCSLPQLLIFSVKGESKSAAKVEGGRGDKAWSGHSRELQHTEE